MKSVPRMVRYLRPYWALASAVVSVILLASAADLLVPWPLKLLLDNALGEYPAPRWLRPLLGAEPTRTALLLFAVCTGLGITLVHNVLNVLNNYFQTKLEQGMVLDFRSDLFRHVQQLSMSYHDQRHS